MNTGDGRQGSLKGRPLWAVLGYLQVLMVIYLSLAPLQIGLPVVEGDKVLHVVAYFVLMSWFANLHADPARRVWLAIGFSALGAILEWLQQWTGYRTLELFDLAASTSGVALGWALAPPRTPNYLELFDRIYPPWSRSRAPRVP